MVSQHDEHVQPIRIGKWMKMVDFALQTWLLDIARGIHTQDINKPTKSMGFPSGLWSRRWWIFRYVRLMERSTGGKCSQ